MTDSFPTLAEQHTTALAEQNTRYAANPRVDDAGDGEAPPHSPPGDAQRQSEPLIVISGTATQTSPEKGADDDRGNG